MPKSTKSQKELYFERLQQQREEAAAAAAGSSEPPRTTGSARSNNDTETKTTGVFVNQGVYHPSLGVIALSYGVDAGYIARKAMKFNNNGELSEGQRILATKQAVSQAYTGMIQDLSLTMLKDGIRDAEITPENIREITENPVLINLFTKYQLGIVLVNTGVDRDDANVDINQENLANLFAWLTNNWRGEKYPFQLFFTYLETDSRYSTNYLILILVFGVFKYL